MLNQAKHKMLMYQILTKIFKDVFLCSALGFKGGTACFFFYNLPRFSVDLDFDIILKPPSGEKINLIFKKVEEILESLNLQIKQKSIKRNTIFFLLSYGREAHNIKVEISQRIFENTYEIKNFYGLPIKVLSRKDMFAHKLAAITERKKLASRDLFDIYFFFKQKWDVNEEMILVRTGKKLKPYLKVLKKLTSKKVNKRNVLQGLGEILDNKQKNWVRDNLKKELISLIDFYVANV